MDGQTDRAFLVTASGTPDLTREQVRTGRFVAPARGVRYPTGTSDVERSRRSAALIGSGTGAVLTDVSAAQAWALPLPPWIGLESGAVPISVSAPRDRNRPRRGDVRGRRLRLPPDDLTYVGGLLTTTPARTWFDCAEFIPIEHIVAMGDVVLSRRLATRDDLLAMIRWARRRRGVVNARRAVPILEPRSQSPGESLVRAHLVLAGIPRPECNLEVIEDGEWLARADLAWPRARLIVEYDGIVHLQEAQRRTDAARRNLLLAAGWLVITFTAADLRRPWLMIALVQSALNSREPRR